MSQLGTGTFANLNDCENQPPPPESSHCHSTLRQPSAQQVLEDGLKQLSLVASCDNSPPRNLSTIEQELLKTINDCIKNWYQPWHQAYLASGCEFKIVYDLMERLLHYEAQITQNSALISCDRACALARAVARLVDYGNAILNIDMIIRSKSDPLALVTSATTTIELFQAHLKAHKLREKLLNDYFRRAASPRRSQNTNDDSQISYPSNLSSSSFLLQVPSNRASLSLSLERLPRSRIGSNASINSACSTDGRSTPTAFTHIEHRLSLTNPLDGDLERFSSETTDLLASLQSKNFENDPTSRQKLVQTALERIHEYLTPPVTQAKLTICFEVIGTLLDAIERLPKETRSEVVVTMATKLLKPIVRKVYIDDRENLVEFQHAHWTAYMVSILNLFGPTEFTGYLRHFTNFVDLSTFIKDYLFIVKRLTATATPSKRDSFSDSSAANKTLDSFLDDLQPSRPTFPEHWIDMTLVSSSSFLRTLTYLQQVLRQFFASNAQIWLSFIECLTQFVLQSALRPKRHMQFQHQRQLALELRQTGTECIWISWCSLLFEQKTALLEDLLEPVLRISMELEPAQRAYALPILHDMMRCDYLNRLGPLVATGSRSDSCSSTGDSILTVRRVSETLDRASTRTVGLGCSSPDGTASDAHALANNHESLPYLSIVSLAGGTQASESVACPAFKLEGTKFTHQIVGKLNSMVMDSSLGDEQFKDELCAALSGDIKPELVAHSTANDDAQFNSIAAHVSDLVAEFVQICLDARSANKLAYNHLYMLCLFKLISFFRDKVDRLELYLVYLYKLVCLHHSSGRYAEAGFTLLEQAKSLPWSDSPLDPIYRIVCRFIVTAPENLRTFTSLKIFLYDTIINYFDLGRVWESALPLCRELVSIYETKTYDYNKVSQVLGKMSTFFAKMADLSARTQPEYFKVTFYGNGLPKCLRRTTMVYRGKPCEKLTDFQTTMLSKYPDAELLRTLSVPDENLTEPSDAKFLQISACEPLVNLEAKFGTNASARIDEGILNYYRRNECCRFTFSRRLPSPSSRPGDDSFANMWRERIVLVTNSFPGMLPFFPVYLTETQLISPIESAIEDLQRTNERLVGMINRFRADRERVADVRLLGQLLLGIVDAAVNGGIAKYEEAFFRCPPSEPGQDRQAPESTNQSSVWPQSIVSTSDSPGTTAAAPSAAQVDQLKSLIAGQLPLLDEATRLHGERVADVLRPQHNHLESTYRKLKQHVILRYGRHLPPEYNRSVSRNSFSGSSPEGSAGCYSSGGGGGGGSRSVSGRAPVRSFRGDLSTGLSSSSGLGSSSGRLSSKRSSQDAGARLQIDPSSQVNSSTIPYKPLTSGRRSLPFLVAGCRTNEAGSPSPSSPDDLRLIRGGSRAFVSAPQTITPPTAAGRTTVTGLANKLYRCETNTSSHSSSSSSSLPSPTCAPATGKTNFQPTTTAPTATTVQTTTNGQAAQNLINLNDDDSEEAPSHIQLKKIDALAANDLSLVTLAFP